MSNVAARKIKGAARRKYAKLDYNFDNLVQFVHPKIKASVISVGCGECGADVGQQCQEKYSYLKNSVHHARWQVYATRMLAMQRRWTRIVNEVPCDHCFAPIGETCQDTMSGVELPCSHGVRCHEYDRLNKVD